MSTKTKSKRKPRMTVQLSGLLIVAVEERAIEEAIPVAVFIRRAVTRLVNEARSTGHLPRRDITEFEEAQRHGSRGPMRQWPNGVSYVADTHIAATLKALAEENEVDVSTLAREAIVDDLSKAPTVRRVHPRDEFGFTTGGAPPTGRASQQVMNEAWRSTNE